MRSKCSSRTWGRLLLGLVLLVSKQKFSGAPHVCIRSNSEVWVSRLILFPMCLVWPIICADHSQLIKGHLLSLLRRRLLLCTSPPLPPTSSFFLSLSPETLLRHPLFTRIAVCRSPRSSYLPQWIYYPTWLKPLVAFHPTHLNLTRGSCADRSVQKARHALLRHHQCDGAPLPVRSYMPLHRFRMRTRLLCTSQSANAPVADLNRRGGDHQASLACLKPSNSRSGRATHRSSSSAASI